MGVGSLLVGVSLFAAAFGVVEGAVVVYLRHIFYPEGFAFPLRPIDPRLLDVELVREAATLAMLWGVAHASQRGGLRRFAVFCWCFGVWDLAYYVALAAFLGWPTSLLTWDVLFLIPRPWAAPVLAPVLVSLSLLGAAWLLLREPEGSAYAWIRPRDWLVQTTAGLVVIASFLWNDTVVWAAGVPERFPWWLFLLGWVGGSGCFGWRWSRRG